MKLFRFTQLTALLALSIAVIAQEQPKAADISNHERSLPEVRRGSVQADENPDLVSDVLKKRDSERESDKPLAENLEKKDVLHAVSDAGSKDKVRREGMSHQDESEHAMVKKRASKPTPDDNKDAATPPPGNSPGTPVKTGPVIDFMLSTWWNSSQFLAQSDPHITFTTNDTYPSSSQNSTSNQTTIFGVEVKERRQFQTMVGLGGGLTDATAIILQALRGKNPDSYTEILNLLFNESPDWIAKGGAGMNMLRIPIGASDFGFQEYTYDDTVDGSNDTTLSQFNIDKSPKRWQTIQDILKINPNMIIMATPWSQLAWMKGSLGNKQGSLHGGSVLEQFEDVFGNYLIKFIQTLKATKGIPIHALSLQNEPLYDGASYPCTKMEADQQARIGKIVRQKLDAAGYKDIGIFAYDHNWDQPDYPIKVFDQAAESFRGAAWHCYGGDPEGQRPFNDAFPNKHIWFTECTKITQFYNEPWNNIKDGFDKIISGSVNYNSETVILWNLALQIDRDGFTVPSLPKTCTNCLAPILVYDNSTGELEGLNRSAIDNRGKKNSKREEGLLDMGNPLFVRDDVQRTSGGLQVSNPSVMNVGAKNVGKVVPAVRDTYYRSSDFVLLAHLGISIRPNTGGKRWAQRVGVVTTEDDNKGPRIKTQLFRNDLGNGSSRWSLIILQWLDHYGYNKNVAEDATIKIKFRDYVASVVLPPGAFTLQWTAPNSEYEVTPPSPRVDGRAALASENR